MINMVHTLGINSIYHELTAALFWGNELLSAAEEERFNGVKHGKSANPYQDLRGVIGLITDFAFMIGHRV